MTVRWQLRRWLKSLSGDAQLRESELIPALIFAALVVAILFSGLVLALSGSDLVQWLDALGNLGTFLLAVATVTATTIWWLKQGVRWPRVDVSQTVSLVADTATASIVYVSVVVRNVGSIPVTLGRWCLWAVPVDPLPEAVGAALDESDGACLDFKLDLEACSGSEFDLVSEPNIFPGESQQLGAFLRIPRSVKRSRIYSFVPHYRLGSTSENPRGWTHYVLFPAQEESHGQVARST
jgi:hypothetical protein